MSKQYSPSSISKKAMWIGALLASCSIMGPAYSQSAPEIENQSIPAQATGIEAWDIASAELHADPTIVFGKLENGMRYAIRHNGAPEGGASVRLTFDVGAREETDDEIGAAHFVEHMAFNGSTNIAEGELVPILERLGLAFGADTNAQTSLEYTTYKLDLPNVDETTLGTALEIMREVASELTIAPDAVDRERGILVSEYQLRNSPQRRRISDLLTAALPGSHLGARVTAEPDALNSLTATQLQAFYRAYYRPEKATLVIVGDIDPAEFERKIHDQFAGWTAQGPARASYAPAIPQPSVPTIDTFVDPTIPVLIELQYVTDYQTARNTVADEQDQLLKYVASMALTNRLAALSRKPDAGVLGGQVTFEKLFRSANSSGFLVIANDGGWREALQVAEQELRRALEHGLTMAEVEEAKANLDAAFAAAAAQSEGLPSADKADAISQASLSDAVILSPVEQLALFRQLADAITPQAVTQTLRAGWPAAPTAIHVSTKQPIEGGADAIAQAWQASIQMAVAPPAAEAEARFAYDDFGPAGTIMEDSWIDDLGIRTISFANGARLNLKPTDFEPGHIAFEMNVGDGADGFDGGKSGLGLMTQILMPLDGLAGHDTDELRRLTAGRLVSLSLETGEDSMVAAGNTTPDDLELQMKLLAARLGASGFRPETQTQWAAAAPVIAQNFRGNPSQMLGFALNYIVTGDDPRFGLSDPAALEQLSMDDLRAEIEPQLLGGAVDLGLVGDFDQDAAIAAFAKTIGALPARPAQPGPAAIAPRYAQDKSLRTIAHDGAADQGIIAVSWPTSDGHDLQLSLTRSLLAEAFQLKLQEVLREELGATYSAQVVSYGRINPNGFGHITVMAPVSPDKMEYVFQTLENVASQLRDDLVDADLLQRARQPMAEAFRTQLRQNSGWTTIVARAQRNPEWLDRRRQRAEILDAITPPDIQQQAQEYLGSPPLQIRIVPAD